MSHPNSNEYAAFAQDTVRVNEHLSLTAGVRYDLQTFLHEIPEDQSALTRFRQSPA